MKQIAWSKLCAVATGPIARPVSSVAREKRDVEVRTARRSSAPRGCHAPVQLDAPVTTPESASGAGDTEAPAFRRCGEPWEPSGPPAPLIHLFRDGCSGGRPPLTPRRAAVPWPVLAR